MVARCQGKKAREGCGQHGPSPLDTGRPWATVAGVGRELRGRPLRSAGFDRDEPPRGERDRGGRLRPSPDWGVQVRVLGVGGCGFAPGIEAREGRDAAGGPVRSTKARPQRSVGAP